MKLTWKSVVACGALAVLIGFLGAVVVEKAMAQMKGPADFDFAGGAQGKVVFSHEKHLAKESKCTACHTKLFKMTKGQRSALKMADMNNGQACGACHDGKVAFSVKDAANCSKCHQKG
ncbi:MAG TPA: cytochrome c3 family protein [Candidatus Methylomirabilis sp.]|nr:cytochrome c3 family protein [Candidatus Methylomirabilis sp.]